ncbi:MAG: response regulator [Pseudomonadota bacterium]|nr:response regulator [Pseudomonadota bacterium]
MREQMEAEYAEIWQEFKVTTLSQVRVLEQAAVALLEGRLDAELHRRAQRDAHRLAGSVGSFGFTRGSQLAREIESLLRDGGGLNPAQVLHLSELVVALAQELEGAPATQQTSAPAPEEDRPLLLLSGVEAELANRVALAATAQGLRSQLAATPAEARQCLAEASPRTVVLLDLATGQAGGGLALLKELAGRQPPLPVLVLADRDAFAERVEVARLGGRGYLQKPLSTAQVLEAVSLVLQRPRSATAHILAVDDDPQVLALLRSLLAPQDMRLTALEDPRQFWETLREAGPDLLILDMEMPYLSGIELCRVVRNDPRWRTLPVLFMTAFASAEVVQRLFAAGADDFVAKPIVGPELVARINNRLERARLLREVAETDPLTGLANRHKSVQELERLLHLAARQSQPLSLAVVDLDRLKEINDRHGHAGGDQVLRRVGELLLESFRGEDVVARWGGKEIIVGMYAMPRSGGVHRLAELLETLRRESFTDADGRTFGVTFSVGVAEYPADAPDLQSLYQAADRALHAAKQSGRDRVLPAGWQPARDADVVLVEDDEALVGLLRHALETRGLRVRLLGDGQAAVDALGGPDPRLRARLILLDVDLPGLNGLAVLRRLARDGVLRRSKVIVLTGRSTESEVLEALTLGAVDHVAKPFSLPVLMQRIRQALDDGT